MGMLPQQIIIQTVKESPMYLKVLLACIPVILAFILGKWMKK